MVKKLAIVVVIMLGFFKGLAFPQSFEGVYQLEIEDQLGQTISKGTGFYLKPEHTGKAYVFTSFHLLNARLLEANKIKTRSFGKEIYLNIAAYDELNDTLALYSDELTGTPWSLASDCDGKINIAGFYNNKFAVVDVEAGFLDAKTGLKKLPVYLNKGFSGAPLFNSNAEICGMVVLSSEQNASSIAVSNDKLISLSSELEHSLYSVRQLRIVLGVEKIVHTQSELDAIVSTQSTVRQFVVGLAPTDKAEKFVLKGANNIVVDAYSDINRLIIHRSNNVMVRDVKAERVMINESNGITVTGCIFDTKDQALLLKDSTDIIVKGNLFKNIDTAIVLKSSSVDQRSLNNDNIFVSVPNIIKNI